MAAYIAKQMVGNQLKSVKGALGGDKDDASKDSSEDPSEDPEILEARREAEEKRKEKHRLMEEDRETMRQGIRDKYGLKKKVAEEALVMDEEGRIGRKKKSPAELAAEKKANEDDDDEDEFAKFPTNLSELSSTVSQLPSKIAGSVGEMTNKCRVQ